jgi:hypothetical protein
LFSTTFPLRSLNFEEFLFPFPAALEYGPSTEGLPLFSADPRLRGRHFLPATSEYNPCFFNTIAVIGL